MVTEQIRKMRQDAVATMQGALDVLEPLRLPGWQVDVISVGLFVWMVLRHSVVSLIGFIGYTTTLLMALLLAPFLSLYILLDLALLSWWFSRQAALKLKGD